MYIGTPCMFLLQSQKMLRVLDLAGNQISSLAPFSDCTELEDLWVSEKEEEEEEIITLSVRFDVITHNMFLECSSHQTAQ